jgi:hypothetical protein
MHSYFSSMATWASQASDNSSIKDGEFALGSDDDDNYVSDDEDLEEDIILDDSLKRISSCKVIFFLKDMMDIASDEDKKNVEKSVEAAAFMVTIAVEAAFKVKTPVIEVQMALGGMEKGTSPHIVWDVGDPDLMKSIFSETPYGNYAPLQSYLTSCL